MTTRTRNQRDGKAFEDHLHRIRELGVERRTHHRLQRAEGARTRTQQIMQALEAVDRIEAVLVELAGDMEAELGRHIEVSRRLFDGRYQLALSIHETERQARAPGRDYFSRVQLLIQPSAGTDQLSIECRSSVRNRDLASATHEDDLSPAATGRIRAFLEQELLLFAQAWCSSNELVHTEDMLDLAWAEAALAA